MSAWSADGRLLAPFTAIALSIAPAPACAEDALPLGDWRADSTGAVESQLSARVEAAAEELSAVLRPLARELLRRAVQPCTTLRIWTEDDAVGVQCDEQVPAVGVPDGRPISYTGRDGRTHSLVLERRGDGLIQRFVTPRGTRTTRFVLDGEVLQVEVALESPRLSEPLRYTIRYRRARHGGIHGCNLHQNPTNHT